MNENTFYYITTTLPYVNAAPHIGFASEIVYADVRARAARLDGHDVVFNTGTDEHGQKIYRKALEEGRDPKEYVDAYAVHFEALKDLLNLSYTDFLRTTDEGHMKAAQELWRRVDANGHIYKKFYSVKYCVGCELEKTDSETVRDECPLHPGKPLELIEEENYFFRFSAFGERLKDLYRKNRRFVLPEKRLNEIEAFVGRGLEDFSISRLREKMPWGVPVPGDDHHVMYVWFDALTNYVSTLGWPDDLARFTNYWGTSEEPNAVQIAGKDNLRQQSAMWQAMLLAADLPPSKQICINGFITVDGQKMSKSIGNVISPTEMVSIFGIDGTRYLLLSKSAFGEDSDISWERMKEKYNADLANGLGNLVSRVLKLCDDTDLLKDSDAASVTTLAYAVRQRTDEMDMKGALDAVWDVIREANRSIEDKRPWDLKKTDMSAFLALMRELLGDLRSISLALEPFFPQTSEKMRAMLAGGERSILFARIRS